MEETEIIQLLFLRDEKAISALGERYGNLCKSLAMHILPDSRDAEECVEDTYLRIWNSIPPARPRSLKAYLARITRNLAFDKYSYNTADMRNTALTDAFEELQTSIPVSEDKFSEFAEDDSFKDFFNSFLRNQSQEARVFFIRRYWYGESIGEIANATGAGQGKIKSSLMRTRNRLGEVISKRGN